MTPVFWCLFAAYLLKTVGFFWFWRRNRLLSRNNSDLRHYVRQAIEGRRKLKADSDKRSAEYRAAYRDLVGDYERLHARYKELGGGNDR